MSKGREALEKLARECGATTYTNRHFPLATAFSFSPMTWEKFCEALAEQPAQQEMTNIERHERNVQKFLAEQPAPQRPQNCGTGYCSCIECVMEQPAQHQEPVALETVYETIIRWDEGGGKRSRRELARRIVALYTSPPASKPWRGLTDDEFEQCDAHETWRSMRNVEAKLREKNA